jgi:hypothetical protein
MSVPKVVEVFNGYRGDVIVCTDADGARYSWTVTTKAIFGGGIISDGTETEDHGVYRRQGDQWESNIPGAGLQTVTDKLSAHLDLVEQAAATYKSSGQVQ